MLDLRANTQTIVPIGPFVDVTDGFTPETGITLGAADEAELLKHGSTTVVDISGATWAAISGMDGWYALTLSTSHTDTEGQLTVVVQDDSVCLPVVCKFRVLSEAAYVSLYGAKDAGFMDVNIKTIGRADTQETEANNLESACAAYSATRGLAGTALPAAAADAAGGLPISDAGGLALDTILDVAISTRALAANQWSTDQLTTLRAILGVPASGTTPLTPTTGIMYLINDNVGEVDNKVGLVPLEVRTELTTELGRIDVATSSRLAPTTAGRTLDVTATGAAGIDWGNIENTGTTVDLSATTIDACDDVTGSVGSVTGGINTSGGTITTLDALDTAQDSQHGTTQTAIGNLNDFDPASGAVNVGSVLGTALAETASGYLADALSFFFDVATPAKTVNDVGVAGAGLSAEDVWTYTGGSGRILTAGTNIVLAKGTGVTGFNDPSASAINTAVEGGQVGTDAAAAAAFASGNTKQTGDSYAVVNSGTHGNSVIKTAVDSKPSASAINTAVEGGQVGTDAAAAKAAAESAQAVTDKLDTAIELDGAVYRYTTNALEQAPAGGGGGDGDWTADQKTAISAILGIPASGTTPDDPSVGILDEIRDSIGGSLQARANRDAASPYQFDIASMADGTYKAVGRRSRAARFRPGAIGGSGIALQVFMDALYGNTLVSNVGTPTVSGGSLTATAVGPRDTSAMILIDGTATAGEERTITFDVTMQTPGRTETVPVTLDVEVFDE